MDTGNRRGTSPRSVVLRLRGPGVSGTDQAMQGAAEVGAAERHVAELRDPAQPAVRTRNRGWLVRRSLVAADVVGLVGAFLVAKWVVPDAPATPDVVRGL